MRPLIPLGWDLMIKWQIAAPDFLLVALSHHFAPPLVVNPVPKGGGVGDAAHATPTEDPTTDLWQPPARHNRVGKH